MQAQALFGHPEVEDWEEGPWRELGWWGPGLKGEQAWIQVKVSAFRQGKGYWRREETGAADGMRWSQGSQGVGEGPGGGGPGSFPGGKRDE